MVLVLLDPVLSEILEVTVLEHAGVPGSTPLPPLQVLVVYPDIAYATPYHPD